MTKSISEIFEAKEKVNIGYIVAGYPNLSFYRRIFEEVRPVGT